MYGELRMVLSLLLRCVVQCLHMESDKDGVCVIA